MGQKMSASTKRTNRFPGIRRVKDQYGFTLLETMLAVAIVVILMAIVFH
jgi:prepilin-type N-terminal cleavage/methylation domain-containing protein